eukprot:TRINITY_DN4963_c2_g1_i1.p1 TRINITY_DN4963_c2_g1~~TRINITY_DN4963_c2_g1_i1.p1  ORF type:complete len:212 (+),score=54.85 TRINITY_DN4963_c2_g1_i1:44-637(+)
MGHMPIIIKTVISIVAALLLIVVLATPSLYKVKTEGKDLGLGVFKSDDPIDWKSFYDHCSDVEPIYMVMKAGSVIAVLCLGGAVIVNLVGHFAGLKFMNTIGMILEVVQIVGGAALVATTLIIFMSKFSCDSGFTLKMKDQADLAYGFYLSCAALLLIFMNLCVGLGSKPNDNSDNYNRYNDGHTQQHEMAQYHQTV